MAARAPKPQEAPEPAGELRSVEVDGIEVCVDLGYIKSWDGIRKAAGMQRDDIDDAAKVVAMVDYYERAIANLDDVSGAMGGAPAVDVLGLLERAIKAATPKN